MGRLARIVATIFHVFESGRKWTGGSGGERSGRGARDRGDHCRCGSCQGRLADPKEGRHGNRGDLEFVRDGKKCNRKFSDADVKRLSASVSATVDGRNIVVFAPQEIVHREHEPWPGDCNEQKGRRLCCAIGRTCGFEKCELRRADHE